MSRTYYGRVLRRQTFGRLPASFFAAAWNVAYARLVPRKDREVPLTAVSRDLRTHPVVTCHRHLGRACCSYLDDRSQAFRFPKVVVVPTLILRWTPPLCQDRNESGFCVISAGLNSEGILQHQQTGYSVRPRKQRGLFSHNTFPVPWAHFRQNATTLSSTNDFDAHYKSVTCSTSSPV